MCAGTKNKKAFTLIELIVVIAVIAMLLSILMPALADVRAKGRMTVCKSNIRQLVLANRGYANANTGHFVPAAADIMSTQLHRWHGVRETINDPFETTEGPLADYLSDGSVKKCPEKVGFIENDPLEYDYEDGCGGYGYNMTYLGSRVYEGFSIANCARTTRDFEVGRPGRTLMFADTAMTRAYSDGSGYYIEYSFVEPRYFLVSGVVDTQWDPSPSIHFRHRGRVNIGWADGHIDAKNMAEFDEINVYGVKSSDMMLGWFEPMDNSLFDLQ